MADDINTNDQTAAAKPSAGDSNLQQRLLGFSEEAVALSTTPGAAGSVEARVWDEIGPEAETAQDPAPTFSGARDADDRAAESMQRIADTHGADIRDIEAFKNEVHIAASQRLGGEGGFNRPDMPVSTSTQLNLDQIAKADPDRDPKTRIPNRDVPVKPDPDRPVYMTPAMQRYYLASLSLSKPKEIVTIDGKEVPIVDAELMLRVNGKLDNKTSEQLQANAYRKLSPIFSQKYDDKEKHRIAVARGLSLAEVDDLHDRFMVAKKFLRPKNP